MDKEMDMSKYCKPGCKFIEVRNNKVFCNAVRNQRHSSKCYVKFEGTNNQKRIA
jgi:hypothetical protein